LIARYGEDVAAESRLALIEDWLGRLPRKLVRENARLSLLDGEVMGIRGDWTEALDALGRARSFFARKGDRRVESLACLKLSTVLANRGDISAASAVASEGLRLAPNDALAIQLRLRGNLAITSTWMEAPLSEVVSTCQRIAVEAKARGWEHFAAIAFHNMGTTLRHMGEKDEAIRNLRIAAKFWAGSPVSPFADNAELVAALLQGDRVGEAASVAESAVIRTSPWPRPNADAKYGRALVFQYQGRMREAADIARKCLQEMAPLGPTAELLGALLVECLWLGDVATDEARITLRKVADRPDPRLDPVMAPARAIVAHASSCHGECQGEAVAFRQWDDRGATHSVTVGLVKIASLGLDHGGPANIDLALKALRRARAAGTVRSLRWWLRRYAPHTSKLIERGGSKDLAAIASADPEGWRQAFVDALPTASGVDRSQLLEVLARCGNRETSAALSGLPGMDIADTRRQLILRQAPRLFIRSFGTLEIRRGSWQGPVVGIDRKRTRTLLGVLVAYADATLTRDMVLDTMWPDSDPAAAVNSLNQTVFQLRRAIDPDYRDGESPAYVISTPDVVQLNSELVTSDLEAFRSYTTRFRENGARPRDISSLVVLVRGEFLAELRYDDWAARVQTAIHAEVRDVLMPIASGMAGISADLSVRAACALIELDAFDEAAHIAMASQMTAAGRRVAARTALKRYAQQLEEDLAEPASPELLTAMGEVGLLAKVQ
jgi:DNA-binding SARP family transcriptional activator